MGAHYHRARCCAVIVDEEAPKQHPAPRSGTHRYTLYKLGRIVDHNVVIACLPAGQTEPLSCGGRDADAVSLPVDSIADVGIGGGVPATSADIHLGRHSNWI